MKIDIYSHLLPERYKEALEKKAERSDYPIGGPPIITNLELRFLAMEAHPEIKQVLTPCRVPEAFAGPETAYELAKIANDEMAELVARHPDRFVAGVATLPMNNVDAALKEADRAIKELKLKGVFICTPIDGKPIDLPELMPLYEKMSQYDLPIWLHPSTEGAQTKPDYVGETESKYAIWATWGWPYQTTLAMTRLVFSGVFDKYPNLKVIAHHCGAMVPYLEYRTSHFYTSLAAHGETFMKHLAKPPIEYFRGFYADTATGITTSGLMCAHSFFGAEHMLFGTDFPFSPPEIYPDTINFIEGMSIPDEEREKIFEGNARRLLQL